MVGNSIVLQHRIDKFLARKYEELPELEQSADDVYRRLAQEVRDDRQNQFPETVFEPAGRHEAFHKARRAHHYGGLHLAV